MDHDKVLFDQGRMAGLKAFYVLLGNQVVVKLRVCVVLGHLPAHELVDGAGVVGAIDDLQSTLSATLVVIFVDDKLIVDPHLVVLLPSIILVIRQEVVHVLLLLLVLPQH